MCSLYQVNFFLLFLIFQIAYLVFIFSINAINVLCKMNINPRSAVFYRTFEGNIFSCRMHFKLYHPVHANMQ